MQAKVPGINYEQAQQGYSIYILHCGNCHRVHNPTEHTQEEWDNILVKMFVKAKMKDANEKLLLQNYLHAKSK